MQPEIERLNQAWNAAWLENDATTVDALMAPGAWRVAWEHCSAIARTEAMGSG